MTHPTKSPDQCAPYYTDPDCFAAYLDGVDCRYQAPNATCPYVTTDMRKAWARGWIAAHQHANVIPTSAVVIDVSR